MYENQSRVISSSAEDHGEAAHGGSRDPPAAPGEPMLKQAPGRKYGPGRGAHTRNRFSGRNSSSCERPLLEQFPGTVSLWRDPVLEHGKCQD